MWYFTSRLIIMIGLLLLIIRLFKKHKIKTILKVFIVIIYISLSVYLVINPVEQSFIKFDDSDKAFHYTHYQHIYKQFDSKIGVFVLAGENCDISSYTFIPKENDKYNFITPFTHLDEEQLIKDNLKIDKEISGDEQLIVVTIDNLNDIEDNYVITDTADSEYTYFYCKYKKEFKYKKFYYTLKDNKKVDVFVNGELVK